MLGVAAIVRDVTKRFEEIEALRKEAAARQTSDTTLVQLMMKLTPILSPGPRLMR